MKLISFFLPRRLQMRRLQMAAVACAALMMLPPGLALASSPVPQRSAAEWMALFQVPSPADSWEARIQVDGQDVRLRLPDESAKLQTYSHAIRAGIELYGHVREKNLAILRKSFSNVEELEKHHLNMEPEYRQSLSKIVMSLYPEDNGQQGISRHLPLLKALPEYTEFDLFVPAHMAEQTEQELRSNRIANKHRVFPVPIAVELPKSGQVKFLTNYWARDLLEVALSASDNEEYGLLPLARARSDDLTRPDNKFLEDLEDASFRVFTVPLFFRSGNFMLAEAKDKRYLFVGEGDLADAEIYYQNAFFYHPPQSAILELFKELSGADSVVVLPNSSHLFHLDMMLIALSSGSVGMLYPLDPENMFLEDALVLSKARQQLLKLGFSVINVPTTAHNILSFKSSTNAIQFQHAKTGRPTILVPQFEKGMQRVAGKEVSLQDMVESAYREAGYDVIFVEDRFSELHGNLHCTIHELH